MSPSVSRYSREQADLNARSERCTRRSLNSLPHLLSLTPLLQSSFCFGSSLTMTVAPPSSFQWISRCSSSTEPPSPHPPEALHLLFYVGFGASTAITLHNSVRPNSCRRRAIEQCTCSAFVYCRIDLY